MEKEGVMRKRGSRLIWQKNKNDGFGVKMAHRGMATGDSKGERS